MKNDLKHITTIGIFAVSTVFVFLLMNADARAQVLGRNLSFSELSTQLKTPDSIAKYMWRHIAYVNDRRQFGQEEYWQSPEETLNNKKGDCEDLALFAQSMLKANGISSFLLNVYGNGFAHTICVFKENGKFNIIDGTTVKRIEAENLNEVSQYIYPFWKKSAIVSPNGKGSGQILKSFEKKMKAHRNLRLFA